MANVVTIEAEARARAGKGAARATRRAGKVPAVIYGAKQAPNLIALDPRVVLRELHRAGWQSRLYEIKPAGEPIRALIRDVQFHPVSDAPEHVDFQRLAPGERIQGRGAGAFRERGHQPRPEARRRAERRAPRGRGVSATRTRSRSSSPPTSDRLDFNDNVRWHDLKGTEERAR